MSIKSREEELNRSELEKVSSDVKAINDIRKNAENIANNVARLKNGQSPKVNGRPSDSKSKNVNQTDGSKKLRDVAKNKKNTAETAKDVVKELPKGKLGLIKAAIKAGKRSKKKKDDMGAGKSVKVVMKTLKLTFMPIAIFCLIAIIIFMVLCPTLFMLINACLFDRANAVDGVNATLKKVWGIITVADEESFYTKL